MNTRRTRRSVNLSNTNEDVQELRKENQIRKRQKSKFDSSDESNSSDGVPAENTLKKVNVIKKKNKQTKKSKFDTDELEVDDKKIQNRKRPIQAHISDNDDSSSDSSVGDYLKTAEEIDLNSTFFNFENNEKPSDFEAIERKIFTGVQRLSDLSESEDDNNELKESINKSETNMEVKDTTNNMNFFQADNYSKKLKEAKACVENYEIRKSNEFKNVTKVVNTHDITHLLSVGETKIRDSIDSSQDNFESDDEMDWEEIEEHIDNQEETVKVPKEGVQITVEMPSVVRKKTKQVDFMACIKRRINRIKKENQIYIHKVHLLCWIAHGNFLNNVLNNETLLAQALSLLPSEQCYPPKHADMKYLEQIVRWYGKMMKLQEMPFDKDTSIKEQIDLQICKKQATCKRNFILLFIIILRSLGLQCRLVLSFQCLPLRPPNSELCSLSTKESNATKNKSTNSDSAKASTSKDSNKTKSKSKSAVLNTSIKSKLNKTLNESIKNKLNQSLSNSKSANDKIKKSSKSIETKINLDNKSKSTSNKKASYNTEKSSKLTLKDKLNKNLKDDSKFSSNCKPELKLEKTEKTKSVTTNISESLKSKTLSKRKSNTKKAIKTEITISQIDGMNDTPPSSPKLKNKLSKKLSVSDKLKNNLDEDSDNDFCISQRHPRAAKAKPIKYKDNDSAASSAGTSSPVKSSAKDINHNRKSNSSTEKTKISKENKINRPSTSKTKIDVRNDIINLVKGQMTEHRHMEKSKKVRKSSIKYNSDYDSDFTPENTKKKTRNSNGTIVKRRIKPRSKLEENESSQDETKKKVGNDIWIEVFLEEEEKWISVDLIKGQVHCVSELYTRASHPASYIIAWNNNLSLKDITARYCPNWNTVTRKLRVDPNWWNQTLKPFVGIKTVRDREEDEDLARQQLDKPLPTTISEYKNHPLYALKRHLLKFEAIYPPDAVTLGFIRNEAVYARECVHTLHSREIWVKHAKVVKPGQTPYKIVTARPKYDRLTGNVITDQPLEIFGIWQVEDYVPPTAENGIVPRNAFGNVELFKPCMLPKKTVHLQLPGLNKIARKLRIDCASAVVGFDFHGGSSHPTFDGYVVCEEFKDVLIAAWEEDQRETAKKEQEKYEKRVYGNWRKLIKGVLIRERLKAKYDFGTSSSSVEKKKLKPSKAKKSKIENRK